MIRDTLTKLSEKENFEEKISAINLLKSEKGDPFFGNKYGTKIIYEFSDYNCGYCKKIFYDLWEITEEFNDVKVIVKEFPINSFLKSTIEPSIILRELLSITVLSKRLSLS